MSKDTNVMDLLEYGADAAISSIVSMAQEGMAKAVQQPGTGSTELFVGFLQALVQHRAALRQQITVQAMAQLEEKADA